MVQVISIVNQKGGVGKTTCTVNLGSALVQMGYRVCYLDNDPQNNLTSYLSDPQSFAHPHYLTMEDVYRDNHLESKKVLTTRPQMTLIPSTSMLRGVEWFLEAQSRKEEFLKTNLGNIIDLKRHHCDFILIDNPPSLYNLTTNALVASDYVLIPIQLEFFSLEGLNRMRETINHVRAQWNSKIKLLGIIPNMVSARRKLNKEVSQAIEDVFPQKLFKTQLPLSVLFPESSGFGKTIHEYAPQSKLVSHYQELAKEVISELQSTSKETSR